MHATQPKLLQFIRRLAVTDHREQTDQELIARYGGGRDEAAFVAIVQRYGPMVYTVCRRVLRDEWGAEDAFQASFLVLARKSRDLRVRTSLADWLYGVARRTALQARAKAGRRATHERSVPASPPADLFAEVSVRETHAILDEELARLPEKYRLPLLLCTLEGLSREDAARRLNWSLNTLKSRLERARALLRRRLTERGLPLAAATGSLFVLGRAAQARPPAALVKTAVRTAMHDAMGPSIGLLPVPAAVHSLAEGMTKAMWMSKVKLMVGVALAMVVTGGLGAGLLAFQPYDSPVAAKPAVLAPPPTAGTKPARAAADTGRAALVKALQAARTVDDPFQRARSLILVARAQTQRGDKKAAVETVRLALAAADGVPTTEEESGQAKCMLLMWAAEAQAEAGALEAAGKTASRIRPDDFVQSHAAAGRRGVAEGAIAAAQAREGHLEEAFKTANTIRDAGQRGGALGDLAVVQAKAGQWVAAKKTAESIEDWSARFKALADLARLQARDGARAEADGLFEQAKEVAARFKDGDEAVGNRAFVLTGVALKQAEAGDLKAALKTAESIPDFAGFPFKGIVLADLRARAGDVRGALQAAETLPTKPRDGAFRAQGLQFVARAQARSRNFDPALRTIGQIRHDFTRVTALAAVGREQARAGDRKASARTFEKALKQAASLPPGRQWSDENSRQEALRTLAAAQAEGGEEESAWAWIKTEPSAYVRTWALVGLAEGSDQRRKMDGRRPGQ